jgi:hypothetical protein
MPAATLIQSSSQRRSPKSRSWRAHFCVGLIVAAGLVAVHAHAATSKQLAHCRVLDNPTERIACFKRLGIQSENGSQTEATPPAKTPSGTDVLETKPVQPFTAAPVNRRSALPGQPLCASRDALAAMLLAALQASDPAAANTVGCHLLPADAQLEVLERYPSGFRFMRITRVKVDSKTEPNLNGGYTVEMGISEGAAQQ